MPRKSSIIVPLAESSASHVRPPDDLSDAARSVFCDLVLACRADHFQQSDTDMLAIFSRAIVLEKTASAGLADDRYVMADGKVSGWLNVLAQATRIISTYSRMLRLNPAARTTPSPSPEPARPLNEYDRMALSLEARRDDTN